MKLSNRFFAFCLTIALCFSSFPAFSLTGNAETTNDDVTQYSYSVEPILSPFAYAVYVKTDNPDPESFRFVDKDTVYATTDEPEAYFVVRKRNYADVLYEQEGIYRVNDGYIFYCGEGMSDGGTLTLQQKTGEGGGSIIIGGGNSEVTMTGKYADTKITVSCPQLQDATDYLIQTYTTDKMDFFAKMDAVQNALNRLAVYPRSVQDSNKPTGYYPALAASAYYPELSLNEHYETLYKNSDGLLLMFAYPFILDSASFPSLIVSVATRLEPSVIIDSEGLSHPYRNITFEGKTETYGGAGSGGYDTLYTKHVDKWFSFSGDDSDYSESAALETYLEKLSSFESIAADDVKEQRSLIAGEIYKNTIAETGGTWIRIAVELMFGSGISYGYAIPSNGYVQVLSNAWVDGRYINNHEMHIRGELFSDHPTASIVVSKMTYTDYYGSTYTQDVLFRYVDENDRWEARSYYKGPYSADLPEEFILTLDEVDAMNVDGKTNIAPESGLIYDGNSYPGTLFTNVLVQGVTTQDELLLDYNEKRELIATIIPDNATYPDIEWSSSDESVAVIEETNSRYYVKAIGYGTAVLTVSTLDGRYTDTCTVTVSEHLSGKCGTDLFFEFNAATGTLTISGEGNMQKFNFAALNGDPFSDIRKQIKTVYINEGVNAISDNAFKNCYSLKEAFLPASITKIGENIFNSCHSLEKININPDGAVYKTSDGVLFNEDYSELIHYPSAKTATVYKIPESVITIGDYTFNECKNLQEIILPDCLSEIGEKTFNDCLNLQVVNLPDSLVKIGDNSFNACESLKSIYIPKNTDIGYYCFFECKSLTSITVAPDNQHFSSKDGVLFDKEFDNLILYPTGNPAESYTIPYGVTWIEDRAFQFNEFLKTVTIPDSVTSIYEKAFYFCIGLESVVIPDSVELITYDAFSGCTNLKSVSLGSGLTRICDRAFLGCTSLEEIYLPESLDSIDGWVFAGCSSLKKISIPEQLTEIYIGAFENCDALTDIYYTGTQEQWDAIVIYEDNEQLRKADLHLHQHVFDSSDIIQEATCSQNGLQTNTCTDCGISKTKSIPMFPHQLTWVQGNTALCISDGNVEHYICSVCKNAFSNPDGTKPIDNVIIKSDNQHKFGEWVVTKEATNNEDGIKTRTCVYCSKKETQTYRNTGDINGDRIITAADARAALRISAKLDKVNASTENLADVDGNGIVTAADARKILRVSAKLDESF